MLSTSERIVEGLPGAVQAKLSATDRDPSPVTAHLRSALRPRVKAAPKNKKSLGGWVRLLIMQLGILLSPYTLLCS